MAEPVVIECWMRRARRYRYGKGRYIQAYGLNRLAWDALRINAPAWYRKLARYLPALDRSLDSGTPRRARITIEFLEEE